MLQQVQQYARAFDAAEVYCCAIVVSHVEAASASGEGVEVVALVEHAWSRRSQAAGTSPAWEPVEDASLPVRGSA